MFLFGTELFLAFWMASKSVGLPAGSPPPVRAATSMFLIIFAKSLPRFASMTAFLCFVVAHLEWPLMRYSPALHQIDEQRVHAQVTRELRVEGSGQQVALPDCDDPTVGHSALDARELRDAGAGLLDPGGADEHRVHRVARYLVELD